MKTLVTAFFLIIVNLLIGQSMYGYMGKRFYVSSTLSASPALIHRNINGEWGGLRLNLIGTFSGNIVLNKKQVLALIYKRYAGVAAVHSQGQGLLFRGFTGDGRDIGNYHFTTNEFGFNYQFFNNDLDAPLGTYVSLGLGIAISKFDVPFQTVNYSSNSNVPTLLAFDNSNSVKSPIIRLGIGKQTVFWNHFLFEYGVDIGLNLGYMASQVSNFGLLSADTQYGSNLTQDEFEAVSKKAVQNRIYMMNLFNFKMGLSYLIF